MKITLKLISMLLGLAAVTSSAELLVYRTTAVNKTTGEERFRTRVEQGFTVYDVTNNSATLLLKAVGRSSALTTNEVTNIVVATSTGPGHNTTTTLAASNTDTNGGLSFFFVKGKNFSLTVSSNSVVTAPKNADGIARSIQFSDASQTNAVVVESSLILHFDPRITSTNNNSGQTYSDTISNLVTRLQRNWAWGREEEHDHDRDRDRD